MWTCVLGGGGYQLINQYLFIDGAYFEGILARFSERYFYGEPIQINWAALGGGFQKIFYYDCLPQKVESETDSEYQHRLLKKQNLFKAINLTQNFHVHYGEIRGKRKNQRQKQVDILIAVHMLTHTFRGSMSRATLLTGDLDFKPLIDSVVEHGMHLALWYDRPTTAEELVFAADERRSIDLDFVYGIATREFRNLHKIPLRSSGPDKQVDGLTHVSTKANHLSDKVEIYRGDTTAVALMPCMHNEGYFLRVQGEDLETLEKYLEDLST